MFRQLLMATVIACLPIAALAQVSDDGKPVQVITDDSIGVYNHWTSDNVYNLQGFCFVESGELLVIEPGTIIKGNEGQGANATALIVARGGKIIAEGTQQQPIIMTTIIDDVDDPNDIPLNDARAKWGGLIVLGSAEINEAAGVDNIEGLPVTSRSEYGGNDNDDNSGILKYISIRHGGSEIGAANEINGLTMGGVGRGTVISHIEVFYNLDDGYEFFGGTVNCDHLVAAFCGDDGFDYDEGFRGSVQFGFIIYEPTDGGDGGEHDGGDDALDGTPFATPLFSNVTSVGKGTGAGSGSALNIRDAAGGAYFNSIFTEYGVRGVRVEVVADTVEPIDSEDQLLNDNIRFYNNIWWGFGNGNTSNQIADQAFVEAAIFTSGNDFIVDPVMVGIDRGPNGLLDPRPSDLSGWTRGWIDPNDAVDGFNPTDLPGYVGSVDVNFPAFEAVTYPGAFDPGSTELWICNWTALSYYGFLANSCSFADCECITDDNKPVLVIEDDSVGTGAGSFTYWSSDNVYNLQGFVFVDDGDTLVIGPGTVIKGNEGQGANATALIVARGGTIFAIGSPTCPIVMTTIIDDVDNPTDIPLNDARAKWGGLIVLGAAQTNEAAGVDNIEGLPVTARSEYGGSDDDDNSGILKYISIRHGGSEIGAANEINGLTMGAVGRGTVISHIEVFYNLDDGFEWFGGTVNCDHLITAFCGDDGFDYDEGFRGSVQYGLIIYEPTDGGDGGEHDGGDDALDGTPFATPLFSNITSIGKGSGAGSGSALNIRDAAGSAYFNSIFTDYGVRGVRVEVVADTVEPIDSEDQLLNDNIRFYNNIWWGFGNGNASNQIADQAFVEAALFTSGNDYIFDPVIAGIDRTPSGGLDPRPTDLTSWTRGWIDPLDPTDGFNPTDLSGYPGSVDINWPAFDVATYPGAFDPNVAITSSWASGWTALNCYGFLGDAVTSCCISRGDANHSGGSPDIADVTYLVGYAFKGGPAPPCLEEGDVNGSGGLPDIADVTYLVAFAFKGGTAPPPCAKSGFAMSAGNYNDNQIEVAVNTENGRTTVSLSTQVALHGLQVDLHGTQKASVTKLTADEFEFFYHEENGFARIGVLDLEGNAMIEAGSHIIAQLEGEFEGLSAVVSDKNHHGVIPSMTTSGGSGGSLPNAYSLHQNYPNPFNPTTDISFSLPQSAKVELTVYNVLGQKVNTLVNSELEAGVHTITWDGTDYEGSKVASTMYFYRLQAGSFTETKKMLLLK